MELLKENGQNIAVRVSLAISPSGWRLIEKFSQELVAV
jgi:hypothetical protein